MNLCLFITYLHPISTITERHRAHVVKHFDDLLLADRTWVRPNLFPKTTCFHCNFIILPLPVHPPKCFATMLRILLFTLTSWLCMTLSYRRILKNKHPRRKYRRLECAQINTCEPTPYHTFTAKCATIGGIKSCKRPHFALQNTAKRNAVCRQTPYKKRPSAVQKTVFCTAEGRFSSC